MTSKLSYDVVVATLNRAESLRECLRMLERQTRKPNRVVIVDASDDHEGVKATVMKDRDPGISWQMLRSEIRSSPYQRNLGLNAVESPIVLMPDDDSMLYPQTADAMLAAYELDTDGLVAGVSGVQAQTSPQETSKRQRAQVRALKDRALPLRNALERRFIRKPFETFPQSMWADREIPAWIGQEHPLVETIGGFLLSLRTEVAKMHRFDETLGYGIGYALHEDMELSMRLQSQGYLLIATHNAPIFHDVHPSRRAGGFNYGFCWIANYVYSARRNMPETCTAWSVDLPRFLHYKIGLYTLRALLRRDQYSLDVLKGARTALKQSGRLMHSTPKEVPDVYKALCDEYLSRQLT